jgi:putative hydroxymethylpyrimidine transport system substrate-binding protein
MWSIRWGLLAILMAALVCGTVGCGSGSEAEGPKVEVENVTEMDLTLDGYPGPENLGVVMADQRGYFEEFGLDVWVRTPGSRTRPLFYVAQEEVDLAISHGPQVALAEKKGAPVTAFGGLISQPTAAMIWLKRSGITDVADLKGKTVGITGLPFERNLLNVILKRGGLSLADVKVERFDYDLVPALVKGRADAILGSWNLEGAELEARGLEPVIERVEDLGVPSYDELVLIGRPDFLARNHESIENLMAAIKLGTEAAVEEPQAAAELIAQANADPLSKGTEAATEATVPLLTAESLSPGS